METIEDYENNFGADDAAKIARVSCIAVPVIIILLGAIPFINYIKK